MRKSKEKEKRTVVGKKVEKVAKEEGKKAGMKAGEEKRRDRKEGGNKEEQEVGQGKREEEKGRKEEEKGKKESKKRTEKISFEEFRENFNLFYPMRTGIRIRRDNRNEIKNRYEKRL